MLLLLFSVLTCVLSIHAIPFERRQTITPLTTSQIDFYTPYSHFASAAYCDPSTTITWRCGAECDANSDFIPVASGGDGSNVQYWFVGYSPSLNSVIVAHQGTDVTKIEADSTDANARFEHLDPTLFPGINSSILVHSGFANEQARTATTVLSYVQQTISTYDTSHITLIGHSLGAAIALLDSVYLPLHLSGISFTTITYGMPRVGNKAFADYVDAHVHLTHVNNKKDPVPTVPGRFMGYVHPAGEVHITETGPWENCPGQDNPSKLCIVGDVPIILEGNVKDHIGPYNGIYMGFCL
ncbi:hypothetical protein AX17_002795 [Amanita inopinata Kibby_2008]|nr:hypothetical protein AX17_002795 [Amanita inopinata Kibby_2008]